MATKTIQIPDVGSITLYKRRGQHSLRLTVAANGEIRVSMPSWLPFKAGEQFALGKAAWIAAHKMEAPSGLQHTQPIGKAHHLFFEASPSATKITTRLKQNQVEVIHPASYERHHTAVQKAAQAASIRALRKEA